LETTIQESLLITPKTSKPEITVDNIAVAQFIYLLLHNEKIRDVIDTVGKKAVLLLGRFTAERKKVLDTLREELRKRDYLPILFDFEVPATRDITETVSLLARGVYMPLLRSPGPISLFFFQCGVPGDAGGQLHTCCRSWFRWHVHAALTPKCEGRRYAACCSTSQNSWFSFRQLPA
jgi:hypothetical protein